MELVVLLIDAMPAGTLEVPDQFGMTLLHSAAYRGATISVTHIAKVSSFLYLFAVNLKLDIF